MKTMRVFEVMYHENNNSGAAADGSHTFRTTNKIEAENFAKGRVYYGVPSIVEPCDVPFAIAARWGL